MKLTRSNAHLFDRHDRIQYWTQRFHKSQCVFSSAETRPTVITAIISITVIVFGLILIGLMLLIPEVSIAKALGLCKLARMSDIIEHTELPLRGATHSPGLPAYGTGTNQYGFPAYPKGSAVTNNHALPVYPNGTGITDMFGLPSYPNGTGITNEYGLPAFPNRTDFKDFGLPAHPNGAGVTDQYGLPPYPNGTGITDQYRLPAYPNGTGITDNYGRPVLPDGSAITDADGRPVIPNRTGSTDSQGRPVFPNWPGAADRFKKPVTTGHTDSRGRPVFANDTGYFDVDGNKLLPNQTALINGPKPLFVNETGYFDSDGNAAYPNETGYTDEHGRPYIDHDGKSMFPKGTNFIDVYWKPLRAAFYNNIGRPIFPHGSGYIGIFKKPIFANNSGNYDIHGNKVLPNVDDFGRPKFPVTPWHAERFWKPIFRNESGYYDSVGNTVFPNMTGEPDMSWKPVFVNGSGYTVFQTNLTTFTDNMGNVFTYTEAMTTTPDAFTFSLEPTPVCYDYVEKYGPIHGKGYGHKHNMSYWFRARLEPGAHFHKDGSFHNHPHDLSFTIVPTNEDTKTVNLNYDKPEKDPIPYEKGGGMIAPDGEGIFHRPPYRFDVVHPTAVGSNLHNFHPHLPLPGPMGAKQSNSSRSNGTIIIGFFPQRVNDSASEFSGSSNDEFGKGDNLNATSAKFKKDSNKYDIKSSGEILETAKDSSISKAVLDIPVNLKLSLAKAVLKPNQTTSPSPDPRKKIEKDEFLPTRTLPKIIPTTVVPSIIEPKRPIPHSENNRESDTDADFAENPRSNSPNILGYTEFSPTWTLPRTISPSIGPGIIDLKQNLPDLELNLANDREKDVPPSHLELGNVKLNLHRNLPDVTSEKPIDSHNLEAEVINNNPASELMEKIFSSRFKPHHKTSVHKPFHYKSSFIARLKPSTEASDVDWLKFMPQQPPSGYNDEEVLVK